MIDTSMFPYSSCPIRLEYEDKSGKVLCFFMCEEHLEKHLERHKLNRKKVTILHRPEDWIDVLDSPCVTQTTKTPNKKIKVNSRKRKK